MNLSRAANMFRLTNAIAGIQTKMPNGAPVILNGASYTPSALVSLFQSQIDAANAVVTAKAAYSAAVQANDALAAVASEGAILPATATAISVDEALPEMSSFAFLPMVCRAARVAARFSEATTLVNGSVFVSLRGTMP